MSPKYKYKVHVYEANLMTYEVEARNENHAGELIMNKGSRLNMSENSGRKEQILPKTTKIEEFRVEEVSEC
tara:strand:+ start:367 stop:579 length:213 start_codon:yes stop_codon:yes gene_type:complete